MAQENETAAAGVSLRPAGARVRNRTRPAQRAGDETREDIRETGPRLRRQRTRLKDAFHIPQSLIPKGMSYEWKRRSVYGKPDHQHQIGLSDNHWKAVPASRHAELAPAGLDEGAALEIDGMILMERPLYLTQEAQEEDWNAAMSEITRKENQLQKGETPVGQFPRDHARAQAATKIGRSYEPIPVPKE